MTIAPGICSPIYFPTIGPVIMLLSTLHSFAYMQSIVVACWNMALVAFLCTSVTLNANVEKGEAGLLQAWSRPMILATILLYGLGLCLFTGMTEWSSEAQIRSDAAAFLLTEKHHASNALMQIFYDVVIELDDSFAVTSSSEDFAALLHHGPGFSLRGTHFEDLLLDDEDRQIFKQRMQQPLTEDRPATADVMHVSMVRAGGDRFQVELFNFQFRGLGGRTCHLLGLREFGDTDKTAAPTLAEVHPPEMFAGRCSVAVTVDSAETGMPVLGFSEGLKQLTPRVARPGCLLRHVIENGRELEMWMQGVMNAHYTENVNPPENAFQVRLKTGGRRRRVLATCSVAFEDDVEMPESTHDEDVIPVQLAFCDIRDGSGSSSSSSRHSRRRGTPSLAQHTHLDRQLPS